MIACMTIEREPKSVSIEGVDDMVIKYVSCRTNIHHVMASHAQTEPEVPTYDHVFIDIHAVTDGLR